MQYEIGQIVSVTVKNQNRVFAGRIHGFGDCTLEDGSIDKYVWVKRGMWGYDEIGPASEKEIAAVLKEEKELLGMIAAGERLIDLLDRCEVAAETEEMGKFD